MQRHIHIQPDHNALLLNAFLLLMTYDLVSGVNLTEFFIYNN